MVCDEMRSREEDGGVWRVNRARGEQGAKGGEGLGEGRGRLEQLTDGGLDNTWDMFCGFVRC